MCIEHLWVDVTAQVGSTRADHFQNLKLGYSLDISNMSHLWLLHFLFLPTINTQLHFFAESWNQHRIQIDNGPNHSLIDMFGFNMHIHGVRGMQLVEDLSPKELEVFGVDWQALQDEALMNSCEQNNSQDEAGHSWIDQRGPPPHLNEVAVETPEGPLRADKQEYLQQELQMFIGSADSDDIVYLWTQGLAICCAMYPDLF